MKWLLMILSMASTGAGHESMTVWNHFLERTAAVLAERNAISRMEIDVDGDGNSEVFLAETISSGTMGQQWHVYQVIGSSWSYWGAVTFSRSSFCIDSEQSELRAWYRVSVESGMIVTYRVSSQGIAEVYRSQVLVDGTTEFHRETEPIRKWLESKKPIVYETPVSIARAGGRVVWREVITGAEESLPPLGETQ